MGKALISVIVPVFNVEKYLPECLDSLVSQTYLNLEIILVDDGSSDQSGIICDEYAKRDARIRVIHKKNEGVNEARISGFRASIGEFVTFVDSDDYVDSKYVECLFSSIIDFNAVMSCVQWVYIKGAHKKKDRRTRFGFFDKDGIEDILRNDFLFNYKKNTNAFNLGLCCKMIKREYLIGVMEQARGLWIGEDLIANLCLLYKIPSLYISSEYRYYYRQYNGQNTRDCSLASWNNQVEQWKLIDEIDRNSYLKSQLPYRLLSQTKIFVKNLIDRAFDKNDFRNSLELALSNPFVKINLLNYSFSNITIQDSLFLYLIKKKKYLSLYNLCKLTISFIRYLVKIKKYCK